MVTYLSESCLVKDVKEVDMTELVTLTKEAWQHAKSQPLPGMDEREVKAWVERVPTKTTGDQHLRRVHCK